MRFFSFRSGGLRVMVAFIIGFLPRLEAVDAFVGAKGRPPTVIADQSELSSADHAARGGIRNVRDARDRIAGAIPDLAALRLLCRAATVRNK